MNIPPIKSIDDALKIYYSHPELGNKEITALFGNHSSATVSRLKKLAKAEMNERNVFSYGANKVNTAVAFDSGKPKQLTRTAYGLEAAKDLERKLTEAQKSTGEASVKKINLQQLYDEYIAVKQYEVKETTIDKYKQNFEYYITPALKDARIDKLNAKAVQDWKLSMEQKGLSPNTKKHAFADLRAMLNYAVKMEYIHKNPVAKIGTFKDKSAIKKEMQFYTAAEFKLFISAAKRIAADKERASKDLSEWDFVVFFCIAFYTGLRKGEIHALKWSDIDGSYLSVKRIITQRLRGVGDVETSPKNQSSIRTLQMPLPLITALKEHRERQEKNLKDFHDDYRICGGERCLRDATVDRKNKLYAGSAGLKAIRIHDFRHSHVSILANEGINIQEVARRLGHSRIEMTWNTYSHLYPREEERAVEILNMVA